MPEPFEDIAAVAAAHARLHRTLDGLTDEEARGPSLLPDWSVGHLITHIARNADSVVRRVSAALDGELVAQYEHGAAGRASDIEAGAGRPATELLADLHASDGRLDALLESAPATLWDGELMAGPKDVVPAPEVVFHRWREVEIHHVDLGMSYSPEDWPDRLVTRWLPALAAQLPERADPRALMAWVLGRGSAPELGGHWN